MAYNYIRGNKRDQSISFADIESECSWRIPSSKIPDPYTSLRINDLREAVEMSIRQLPPNQRSALVLAKFENKSYADIAEILDVSESAVKMLVKRARENLAILLKGY